MLRRTVALAVLAGVNAGLLLGGCGDDSTRQVEVSRQGCQVVYGGADTGAVLPIGVEYDGAQWTLNGRVIGWSTHEDTEIVTGEDCIKK